MTVLMLSLVVVMTVVALAVVGLTLLVAWEDRRYAVLRGYRRPMRLRARLRRHPGKRVSEV